MVVLICSCFYQAGWQTNATISSLKAVAEWGCLLICDWWLLFQYIQQNIRSDCSNIDKILEPPEGQDEGVWKYEHLRQFCLELNGLAVKLQVSNQTEQIHTF